MLYQRLIRDQLDAFINDATLHKNVLLLIGPRQVGKSTILKEVTKDRPHLFLNFEKNPSFAEQIDLLSDFDEFQNYLKEVHRFDFQKQVLVIDEAQLSQKLGSFVRFMKEEWDNATVILTGSTITEMHQKTRRQPVGRESYLEMGPMSFLEFLMAMEQTTLVNIVQKYKIGQTISQGQHARLFELYEKYLLVGGLPQVVSHFIAGKDFQKLRRDIFKSYEDDFIRYYSLEDVSLFKRCLETVANNAGSPSKDSQAVRVDAPGYKKISGIFSRLETWRLIIKCQQLGLKPEKNKYHPKRYLYDAGILSDLRLKGLSQIHLDDISSAALRTPLGGLVENAMAISLRRQFEDDFFGIKMTTGSEIDFAVKHDGVVHPVECKISLRFKQNFAFGIREYQRQTGKASNGFIFFGGMPQPSGIPNITALPYYLCDGLKNMIERHNPS